jgi:hypothetical protein
MRARIGAPGGDQTYVFLRDYSDGIFQCCLHGPLIGLSLKAGESRSHVFDGAT